MESIAFRKLEDKDKSIVKNLLYDIFKKDFGDLFFDEINNPTVLEFENQTIGFLSFSLFFDESELLLIALKPEFQNKGYGKMLMEFYLKTMKDNNIKTCYLEVSVNNLKAINFYKRFGFSQYGFREKYYSNGDDAILMKKEL